MRKNIDLWNDKEQEELNMTPMLDVVFILLIFFIVAANFNPIEKMQLDLAQLSETKPVATENLSVYILPSGALVFESNPVTIEELSSQLKAAYRVNKEAALLVVADELAPTGQTLKVLDLAHQLGIHTSSVAAQSVAP